VTAWLDERELRLGDVLGPAIEQHIQTSTALVVIATASAAKSTWVEKEITFARTLHPPKSICPLFIENVKTERLFSEHLGLDATDPHQFERAVLKLAEAMVGAPLPPPAVDRLTADLEALQLEEPALALLVADCLQGDGLRSIHLESVAQVPFHSLDYALNALYDVAPEDRKRAIAGAAAYLFVRTEAGSFALEKHVRVRGDDNQVLNGAVGRKLADRQLDVALSLLSACSPPEDQALSSFIFHNGDAMNSSQRRSVVRLMTHPPRKAPTKFAAEAAFQALKQQPESRDLKEVWDRWISDGLFDGAPGESPNTLGYFLGEAFSRGLTGWDEIGDALIRHVEWLARSTDSFKVSKAVNHVMAAADRESPLVDELCAKCIAATGSAEWDGWADRMKMSLYVSAHVKAAKTDRDWSSAYEKFEESWKAVQRANKLRSERQTEDTK
jgi:TIR domain